MPVPAMPTTVKPEVVFIEELLNELRGGTLQVPRFQRPFIWKPADMRSLFDSICRGYPIGSLLIWDSPEPMNSLGHIGPLTVAAAPKGPISYVLDGHQRLITLLTGLCIQPDAPLTRAQHDWQYWVWFDLEREEFAHVTDARPPPHYFPLRALLNTMDFIKESRRLTSDFGSDAPRLVERAEVLCQKVKTYKLPTIRIRGGTLREAVEIFARLNSKGSAMTADQMLTALTYRGDGKPTLADHIDEILDEMDSYRFGGIPRQQILQSVLGAAGLDINTNEWEAIAGRLSPDLHRHVDKARRGLVSAARFLAEDIGLPGDGFLPYVNQIVLLAAFFWSTKEGAVPSEKLALLRTWFWSTSLTGWFAGANPSQLRDRVHEIEEFAAGDVGSLTIPRGTARPLPPRYDSRSARVRCLMTFLYSLKPRHTDGTQVAASELSDVQRGFEYVFTAVPRETRSNPANRVLLPRGPGRTVRHQLLHIEEDDLEEILASHCIPLSAYECLQADDAGGFIAARRPALLALEADFIRARGVGPAPEADGSGEDDEADVDTD